LKKRTKVLRRQKLSLELTNREKSEDGMTGRTVYEDREDVAEVCR